jgi:membrane protease YdiL (CAAX protease family)
VGYPVWGIIQQYVLLVFLLPRLNYLIEKPGKLVLIIAVIFSTSHLPNPFLVILTFPVSIIFLFFFLKYRNLYIQGFVHGFIGSIMKFCLPQDWTLKFWIGNLISWNNFINYFF